MIKRQIADDRAAREVKIKPTVSKDDAKKTAISSTVGSSPTTSGSCLIQVCDIIIVVYGVLVMLLVN